MTYSLTKSVAALILTITFILLHQANAHGMRMYQVALESMRYSASRFDSDSFQIESKEICQSAMDELDPMQLIIFDMMSGSNCASIFSRNIQS